MAVKDGAPESSGKKSKLKIILLVIVVAVLAVALSVAGTLWFLGDDRPGKADAVAASDDFAPAQYLGMDKAVVTTVRHPGRQRYVQVHLAFESTEPAALAAAEKHLPLLRNTLLAELGQLEFMTLQTLEGRQALPGRLLTAVNDTLAAEGEPTLDRVLLRNFVVQ